MSVRYSTNLSHLKALEQSWNLPWYVCFWQRHFDRIKFVYEFLSGV